MFRMSYEDLLTINKALFTQYDVAHALCIRPTSAEVFCSRYVRKGLLMRLKRGLYARTETLGHLSQRDLFRIANILQVPSYISLITALTYWGITAPAEEGPFESISVKRTKTFGVGNLSFRYSKIRADLYREFMKNDGVFIALPEKALLDSLYLASIGRYNIDKFSFYLNKLDGGTLSDIATLYPQRAREYFERFYAKTNRP
jgi:hypothetical protein